MFSYFLCYLSICFIMYWQALTQWFTVVLKYILSAYGTPGVLCDFICPSLKSFSNDQWPLTMLLYEHTVFYWNGKLCRRGWTLKAQSTSVCVWKNTDKAKDMKCKMATSYTVMDRVVLTGIWQTFIILAKLKKLCIRINTQEDNDEKIRASNDCSIVPNYALGYSRTNNYHTGLLWWAPLKIMLLISYQSITSIEEFDWVGILL